MSVKFVRSSGTNCTTPMPGTKLVGGDYLVPLHALAPGVADAHVRFLTFHPKLTGPAAEGEAAAPVCAAGINGDWLAVPRGYGIEQFGLPSTGFDPLKGASQQVVHFEGSLREEQHQPQAAAVAHETLQSNGGCTLVLPCGFGKTTVALNIAQRIGGRCLILVHKSVLLTQWVERIQQFLPAAKIGTLQGADVDAGDEKDIVIGMLQSVY